MKTTIGELRRLVKEASRNSETSHGDANVGEWYVTRDTRGHEQVEKLTGIRVDDSGTWVNMRHPEGFSQEMLYDRWLENTVGVATPEQVAMAKARAEKKREWMSKEINTSREGT
jgi:hypothetical protein